MTRSRIRAASATTLAVLGGLVAAGGALVAHAASEVPKITNLSTNPSRFCVRNCANPGTTIRFTISSNATVTANVWPRFRNGGGYLEFRRRFNAGTNSVRLNDPRLTKGRWQLKLQGLNNVGAGTTATTLFVVK